MCFTPQLRKSFGSQYQRDRALYLNLHHDPREGEVSTHLAHHLFGWLIRTSSVWGRSATGYGILRSG